MNSELDKLRNRVLALEEKPDPEPVYPEYLDDIKKRLNYLERLNPTLIEENQNAIGKLADRIKALEQEQKRLGTIVKSVKEKVENAVELNKLKDNVKKLKDKLQKLEDAEVIDKVK